MDLTDTLFPDLEQPPAAPVEKLSADRRRTRRQKEAIARGIHPVTGLHLTTNPDATCGNCALRDHFGKWSKCTYLAPPGNPYAGPYVTNSAATDIRAWWPGCDQHQPKEEAS